MTNLLSQSESATLVVTVVEFLVTALSCRGDVLLFIFKKQAGVLLRKLCSHPFTNIGYSYCTINSNGYCYSHIQQMKLTPLYM